MSNDIDVGQISEALNDKVDRDNRNVDNAMGADAVIEYQNPSSSNNYTWYRKYKTGYVEQGGRSSDANTSGVLVTMAIVMSDTDYSIMVSPKEGGAYGTSGYGGSNKTITTFKVYSNNNNGRPVYWEVRGMAAS